MVLGFDNLSSYLVTPHPYFGAIAGRVAGRLAIPALRSTGGSTALRQMSRPTICMAAGWV